MTVPAVSVVIPIGDRLDGVLQVCEGVQAELHRLAAPAEIILVLDGRRCGVDALLDALEARALPLRVLSFERAFGEGEALRAGFQAAAGDIIVTHPAHPQVDFPVLGRLVEAIRSGQDMAIAARRPDGESVVNRAHRRVYNTLLRALVHTRFTDLGCGVRAVRRTLADTLTVRGDLQRYLAVQAALEGFNVIEVPCAVHPAAARPRLYGPAVYAARLLDLLSLYFVSRFMYRPIRFFGAIGGLLFLVGVTICAYLSFVKLTVGLALSSRPLFLLGVLLIAFGYQTFAIGLLGELLTSTRRVSKPFRIKEVFRREPARAAALNTDTPSDGKRASPAPLPRARDPSPD